MSYFRRPNPKSNWKRPKPKIYDCNTRDLESFYQSSYNDYLNTKSDILARQRERQDRGDAEQLTQRFERRRASSLVYGEDDTPRQHRFIPARQNSNEGTSGQSYTATRSRIGRAEATTTTSDDISREPRSTTSASRSVTFSSSVGTSDSSDQMASIEQRLEKLRKLREELGLPAEINPNGTASVSSSILSTTETSSSRQPSPSPMEARESRSKDKWTKTTTVRSDSRTRASPARSTTESSYSTKSERSTLRNGLDDEMPSYSSRTSRTAGGTDSSSFNGLGNSYESSTSSTRSRKRVEKPSLDGIDLTVDDDALLTDVKKKFPSSQEILERIKNMEMD